MKQRMLCLLAVFGAVLFAGCRNGPNLESDIHYVRDMRTGLCFATDWNGAPHGGHTLTHVPCEAVMGKVEIKDLVETRNP